MSWFGWLTKMFKSDDEEIVEVRTRDKKGRFIKDDPATEKNEAFKKVKRKKRK